MIRRTMDDRVCLFTQVDHARLAGEFARSFGNSRFKAPVDPCDLLTAVAMHDEGWPLHDDAPTLNAAKLPTDVFESDPFQTFPVWAESARRAAAVKPYVGLLVSLHVFALSIHASRNRGHVNMDDPAIRFALNKFQHAQIELQEQLRTELGMRTDIPLTAGLSPDSTDPVEQKLCFDLRLLQAMDSISLAVLCEKPPFSEVQIKSAPGERTMVCRLKRTAAFEVEVDPWLFGAASVRAQIPCRVLPRRIYKNAAEFVADYSAAPLDAVEIRLNEVNQRKGP